MEKPLNYQHRWNDGHSIDWPPGKVVCVGRNYAAHARELGNEVPKEPLLFMKPATALVSLEAGFSIPEGCGEVHHEAEIALLIGDTLSEVKTTQAGEGIAGIGLALDLTLRELQSKLKQKGHPWERAKAFDGSCPLSRFVPRQAFDSLEDISLRFSINGQLRQQGSSAQMMFSILDLLAHISAVFTLQAGDVVLTGTPAGVGPLAVGDVLKLELPGYLKQSSSVITRQ
jgi:2-keto-4-pentenoate hydratase/2-oxohepta-3-ene-1,7-dioic acid hydratase in catechol pathway